MPVFDKRSSIDGAPTDATAPLNSNLGVGGHHSPTSDGVSATYYRHFPGFSPRPTVELHPLLDRQRQHIDSMLEKLGVTETRLGLELEFRLVPIRSGEVLPDGVLTERIEELRERAAAFVREQNIDVDRRLAQIANFSAGELVMFELIELNESTRGHLEYAFGTGRGDGSYYDGVGTFELKIRPVESGAFPEVRRIVFETLMARAAHLGLMFSSPPEPQLNVSFWREDRNLVDPEHPEFRTTGVKLIAGVQRGVYDGAEINSNSINSGVGSSREDPIRVTGEGSRARIEIRPLSGNGGGIAWHDLDTQVEVIIKPGACWGLLEADLRDVTLNRRPVVDRATDECKLLLHTLQGSHLIEIDPKTFGFVPPRSYIMGEFKEIAGELGVPFSRDIDRARYVSKQNAKRLVDVESGLVPPPSGSTRESVIAELSKQITEIERYARTSSPGGSDFVRFIQQVILRQEEDAFRICFPPAVRTQEGQEFEVDHARLQAALTVRGIVDAVTIGSPGHYVDKREKFCDSAIFSLSSPFIEAEYRTALYALHGLGTAD